jgi:Tol biopolymer transport system component
MTRPLLVCVIAALGLAAVAAPSASAAPKEIAYRCDLDICLLDPDNPGDITNLTDNGATSYDSEPVWSPDGKKLAFVATFKEAVPPTPNVYVMEADAAEQSVNLAVQVTHYANGNVPLDELAWSRDGTKIAYARGVANPGSQPLFVVQSDGTTAKPLEISPHGGHPSWSPDSSRIAYWFSNQVYLKNADGSGPESPLLNGGGREPAWSPDGSRIAFGFPAHPAEFLDLHIVPAGGGAPVIVASNTQFMFEAWSPDGSRIAYRNTAPTNQEGGYVRVVNADGGGDHGLPIVQGLNVNGPAPSWSPDGSRLVFHGFYFGNISTESDDTDKVYIANADGSGSVTSLTGDNSYEPAWRPSAKALPPPSPPVPGPRIKAKVIWITKRIPWTPGQLTIHVASVFCDAPVCSVGTTGKAKYVGPPSVLLKDEKKVAKTIVVGRGHTKIPRNKKRPLKLKLTHVGIAALKTLGKLTVKLKVTISVAGAGKLTQTHTVHVVKTPRHH